MTEVVFDEVKASLMTDFPALQDCIIPLFKRVTRMRNAQVVGKQFEGSGAGMSRPALSEAVTENGFVYASFVKPGKHSVFVYDPVSDKFYQKVIVVQNQRTEYELLESP